MIVTSQLLPLPDAIDIVAPFGLLVAELNDPKRYNPGLKDTVPFSLLVKRLAHSKRQIQTALAIVIAEHVVQFARERSSTAQRILIATSSSSGDLAWFTVQPIFSHTTKPYAELMWDGQNAYRAWWEECERYLKTIAGQPINSSGRSSWPSSFDLAEYWRTIDRSVPKLLEKRALRAIRDV